MLFSQGSRVVLGHSVRELTRGCQKHDPAFAEVEGEAALLDQFYIPTRYPNGLPSPAIPSKTYTAAHAEAAQEAAGHVLRTVEAFLRTHTDVFGLRGWSANWEVLAEEGDEKNVECNTLFNI